MSKRSLHSPHAHSEGKERPLRVLGWVGGRRKGRKFPGHTELSFGRRTKERKEKKVS